MNQEEASDAPVVPRTFLFSHRAGNDSSTDLELRISAFEERISSLDNRSALNTISGGEMPILKQILAICDDPESLETLGKVLIKVATILPELKELTDRKKVIDILQKNPAWFAATYADFSGDVDQLVSFTHDSDSNS